MSAPDALSPASIGSLQRTIGNQAVGQLLARSDTLRAPPPARGDGPQTATQAGIVQRKPSFDDSWSYGALSLWGALYPADWEKQNNALRSAIGSSFAEFSRLITACRDLAPTGAPAKQLKALSATLQEYDRPIGYKEAKDVKAALDEAVEEAQGLLADLQAADSNEEATSDNESDPDVAERSEDEEQPEESSEQDEEPATSEDESLEIEETGGTDVSDEDMVAALAGPRDKPKPTKTIAKPKPQAPVPFAARKQRAVDDVKGEVVRCARDPRFHYNRFHGGYTIGHGPFSPDEKRQIRQAINDDVESWIGSVLPVASAKVLWGKAGKGQNFNVGAYDAQGKQVLNLHFLW